MREKQVVELPESKVMRYRRALDAYERNDYVYALGLAKQLIDEDFYHANSLAGLISEAGGYGVSQDYEQARFYYQRAVDTVGAVEGWLGLARLFYYGNGVSKDIKKATELYAVVVEDADHPTAHLMLGRIFADRGPGRNVAKARDYFRAAARKGSVFAYSYWAFLESTEGNTMLSLWLRLKAAILAFVVSVRDRNDPRLRRS